MPSFLGSVGPPGAEGCRGLETLGAFDMQGGLPSKALHAEGAVVLGHVGSPIFSLPLLGTRVEGLAAFKSGMVA